MNFHRISNSIEICLVGRAPELGILLESIDYHEAARKASFLGSMCEDSLMAAI